MAVVAIGKLPHDGHPPDACPVDIPQDLFDLFFVRRLDLASAKIDAAFQEIGIGADPVGGKGETAAGEKQKRRTLSLSGCQEVGHERGAEDDPLDAFRFSVGKQLIQHRQKRPFQILLVRKVLDAMDHRPFRKKHPIRIGTADVYTDQHVLSPPDGPGDFNGGTPVSLRAARPIVYTTPLH